MNLHDESESRGNLVAAERVRLIAAFFGIDPAGREMAIIAGIGVRRLGALLEGHPPVRLGVAIRGHLRTLAHLIEASGLSLDEAEAAARANWLLVPSISSDFGLLRPLEFLADRRSVAERGELILPPAG